MPIVDGDSEKSGIVERSNAVADAARAIATEFSAILAELRPIGDPVGGKQLREAEVAIAVAAEKLHLAHSVIARIAS